MLARLMLPVPCVANTGCLGAVPSGEGNGTARNLRAGCSTVCSMFYCYIYKNLLRLQIDSISRDVLIAFVFPFLLVFACCFLSLPLPALRPATSVKLRLKWDVARCQNDEVLRLRRRYRDLEPWYCRLRRRRSFRLRRSLGQEKKVDSNFDASVLQLLQLSLLLLSLG